MIINEVILQRKVHGPSNSLFGVLNIVTMNHGTLKFSTVENTNKKIQAGTYDMRWSLSPKFKTKTLEIMGVPDRYGIRIHPCNRGYDVEGCIGIGIYNENDSIPVQIWNSRQSTEIVESLLWRGEEPITIYDIEHERKINTKISNGSIAAFT
jgi:hypothetical protein